MSNEVYVEEMDDGDYLAVYTPYSSDFILALKEEIPNECRNWNSDEKRWEVDSDYFTELDELICFHFNLDTLEVY